MSFCELDSICSVCILDLTLVPYNRIMKIMRMIILIAYLVMHNPFFFHIPLHPPHPQFFIRILILFTHLL